MLKKLPKAQVWVESEEERRERFIGSQFENEELLSELIKQKSLEGLNEVRVVVFEAITSKLGEEQLKVLNKTNEELTKEAIKEAAGSPRDLWCVWLYLFERRVWGTIEGQDLPVFPEDEGPSRPADDALVRVAFPKVGADYVDYLGKVATAREIASEESYGGVREINRAMNEAFQPVTEKYALSTFVGKNSKLLKTHYKEVDPALRLDRLGEERSKLEVRDVEEYAGAYWDKRPATEEEFPFSPPELRLDGDTAFALSPETAAAVKHDADDPVPLGSFGEFSYWLYQGAVYRTEEDDLEADEVQALIEERANKKKARIAKAKDLQAMREDDKGKSSGQPARKPIPEEIRHAVWRRDEGKCVNCGSNEELEFDHIIPLAMGGANTERNLQLLCAPCNRSKGATLG